MYTLDIPANTTSTVNIFTYILYMKELVGLSLVGVGSCRPVEVSRDERPATELDELVETMSLRPSSGFATCICKVGSPLCGNSTP